MMQCFTTLSALSNPKPTQTEYFMPNEILPGAATVCRCFWCYISLLLNREFSFEANESPSWKMKKRKKKVRPWALTASHMSAVQTQTGKKLIVGYLVWLIIAIMDTNIKYAYCHFVLTWDNGKKKEKKHNIHQKSQDSRLTRVGTLLLPTVFSFYCLCLSGSDSCVTALRALAAVITLNIWETFTKSFSFHSGTHSPLFHPSLSDASCLLFLPSTQ